MCVRSSKIMWKHVKRQKEALKVKEKKSHIIILSDAFMIINIFFKPSVASAVSKFNSLNKQAS